VTPITRKYPVNLDGRRLRQRRWPRHPGRSGSGADRRHRRRPHAAQSGPCPLGTDSV